MQQSTFDTLLASNLREALMEQNQGTLMQQSTCYEYETLLARKLREADIMQQSTFDLLLGMKLQFTEDAGYLMSDMTNDGR